MNKKLIYGDGLKGQLKAKAKDKIHRFMLADGKLRGAICHTTAMANEMRANHELGILESLVLGAGIHRGIDVDDQPKRGRSNCPQDRV